MSELVFLLEEESMADLLDIMLPRFFPKLQFTCVPHKGKSKLRKKIPGKIKAWYPADAQFVVMQDQNSSKCRQIKARLVQLCEKAGRDDVLVRIVCRELESWYLGEPDALAQAYPNHASRISQELRKSQYRNSDTVQQPARILKKFIPGFKKRDGARRMGELLSRENTSRSFQVFLKGVEKLYASMQTTATA